MGLPEDIDNLLGQIKRNLINLDRMKIQNDEHYALNFLTWIREMTDKNKAIYNSKLDRTKQDHETYKKYRQRVYWIDFGKNIGSEFNDWHFAVVIRDSAFTALVVPISTEKENTPDWKIEEDLIVPIGELILPNEKEEKIEKKSSYAMIHQMQVVSKKRLSRYGDKASGFYDIELTNQQMDLIDCAIKSFLVND